MKETKYFESSLLYRNDSVIVDNAVTQELPPHFHFNTHVHVTVELIVCLSGSLTLVAYNNPIELSAGDYMVIMPNTPHSCDCTSDNVCSILQTHFHTDVFKSMVTDDLKHHDLNFLIEISMNHKKLFKSKSSEQISNSVRYMKIELDKKSDNWEKMLNLYLSQLIIIISRDMSQNLKVCNDNFSNCHVIKAMNYINKNYNAKLTIGDIAQYCGITSRYLCELFSEGPAINISTYITYTRINKAIEIMISKGSHYPLTQLSMDVGFSSLQHFSKMFKNKMGTTPTKYFEYITQMEKTANE